MTPRVDLVWLGTSAVPPVWPLGSLIRVGMSPRDVVEAVDAAMESTSVDAFLFWDSAIVPPIAEQILRILDRPGDIWHAGLALGLGGLPGIIDFVSPTWMFNRDPDVSVEATNWRISLRACLVRADLLRWGGPRADFETLEGAALEWGHRCVMNGALPRHMASLLPSGVRPAPFRLTLADEFRFARICFGTRWSMWAGCRAAITRYASFEDIAEALIISRRVERLLPAEPYRRPSAKRRAPSPTVAVLIPTIDRYPYLRVLLKQLRRQTVPPSEIIVVDQTPIERRDRRLEAEYADLPLRIIALDRAGQCTARNAGLAQVQGGAILFLDDDDEIGVDLVAGHLEHLAAHRADISSGVAEEPSSGRLPEAFKRARASDVFPTNNTLAQRSALVSSGLFDAAYDHGARADGDLGMRLYLSGAVMMLNPGISVLHHHAPRGGLRTFGARSVTYASSRRRIMERQLLEVTDLYRALRYHTERQLQETIVQSIMGTLVLHGNVLSRVAKLLFGVLVLPDTIFRLHTRLGKARALLSNFPQIPRFLD